MKTSRILIVIGPAILLIGGLAIFRLVSHAWLSHSIVIKGASLPLAPSHSELSTGRGFLGFESFGNLETEYRDGLMEVAAVLDADGKTAFYSESPPEEVLDNIRIYERVSRNIFGKDVLKYSVHASVSRFSDNQYFVTFSVAGGGHADYTVSGEVSKIVDGTATIEIEENVFGDGLQYDLVIDTADFDKIRFRNAAD